MKIYGKMLKKIFGAATVCVAFGAISLKADFKQDLINVCKKHKVNPGEMSIFLESYKLLYQDFKGKVVVKMRKLHNLRLQEKKIIDDGSVFCPGQSEIEMLKFAKWLWNQVQSIRETAQQSTCGHGVLAKECHDAFMRRICSFGFACIRFFAGRFASEKMLFDEKDIEFKKEIIDRIIESFPAALGDCIRKKAFCNGIYFPRLLNLLDQKNAKWGWEEYIRGIYERCWSILDHASDCRLYLEKLLEQDFDKINTFWKRVKGDANVLREDYEIKEKIDKLKEEKERVASELYEEEDDLKYFETWKERLSTIAIVTYNESGEIVSATPKSKEHEYNVGVGVDAYKRYRFLPVKVEKLRNMKTSLETKITKLETKLHIKDYKLIEGIFAFRKYNACLKFFFYLHASYQYALKEKSVFPNVFEEEYDSVVEIFTKRRCDSFDGAVMNGFRKSKNLIHAGKVTTKKSFLNMENKTGNTTLFNTKFMLDDESNTINQIKFMPDDEEFEPINQIDFVNKSALK